jgi:hypothetical protein
VSGSQLSLKLRIDPVSLSDRGNRGSKTDLSRAHTRWCAERVSPIQFSMAEAALLFRFSASLFAARWRDSDRRFVFVKLFFPEFFQTLS